MSRKNVELLKNRVVIGVQAPEWAGKGHWIAAGPVIPKRPAATQEVPPPDENIWSRGCLWITRKAGRNRSNCYKHGPDRPGFLSFGTEFLSTNLEGSSRAFGTGRPALWGSSNRGSLLVGAWGKRPGRQAGTKKRPALADRLLFLGDTRVELVTPSVSYWCSNQLS